MVNEVGEKKELTVRKTQRNSEKLDVAVCNELKTQRLETVLMSVGFLTTLLTHHDRGILTVANP